MAEAQFDGPAIESLIDGLVDEEPPEKPPEEPPKDKVSEEQPKKPEAAADDEPPPKDADLAAIHEAYEQDPEAMRNIIDLGLKAQRGELVEPGTIETKASKAEDPPPDPRSTLDKGFAALKKIQESFSDDPEDYPTKKELSTALDSVNALVNGVLEMTHGGLLGLKQTLEAEKEQQAAQSKQEKIDEFNHQLNALKTDGTFQKVFQAKDLPRSVVEEYLKTNNLKRSWENYAKKVGLTVADTDTETDDKGVQKGDQEIKRNAKRLKSLSPSHGGVIDQKKDRTVKQYTHKDTRDDTYNTDEGLNQVIEEAIVASSES